MNQLEEKEEMIPAKTNEALKVQHLFCSTAILNNRNQKPRLLKKFTSNKQIL